MHFQERPYITLSLVAYQYIRQDKTARKLVLGFPVSCFLFPNTSRARYVGSEHIYCMCMCYTDDDCESRYISMTDHACTCINGAERIQTNRIAPDYQPLQHVGGTGVEYIHSSVYTQLHGQNMCFMC